MKIAEGLAVLELGPEERRMNATLVWDEKDAVLIDTGLPGQLEDIRSEMEKVGVPFNKVSKVIITHHDIDHIGNLSSIIKNSDMEIEVLSHAGEKPYIEGEKLPIKMTEEMLNSMPEDKRKENLQRIKSLHTTVSRTIEDEEVLSCCGGIELVYTPGHTPGHSCLYLKKYKTLITGDAMNVVQGELSGPNPGFTFNMDMAVKSLKKLAKYDIETVVCYHGGIFTNNPNQKIAELASK